MNQLTIHSAYHFVLTILLVHSVLLVNDQCSRPMFHVTLSSVTPSGGSTTKWFTETVMHVQCQVCYLHTRHNVSSNTSSSWAEGAVKSPPIEFTDRPLVLEDRSRCPWPLPNITSILGLCKWSSSNRTPHIRQELTNTHGPYGVARQGQ